MARRTKTIRKAKKSRSIRKGTGSKSSPFKKGTRQLKKGFRWPGNGRQPVKSKG